MAHFSEIIGNTTDAYLDLQDRIKDDCVTAGMTFIETVTTGTWTGHILSSAGTSDTAEVNWYLGILTNTASPDVVRVTVAEGWDTSTKTFSGFVPRTLMTASDTSGGNRAADPTNNFTTTLSPVAISNSSLGSFWVETRDLGYRYELNVLPDRIVLATKCDTGTSIIKRALYAGLFVPADLPNPPAGHDVQLGVGWFTFVEGLLTSITGTATTASGTPINRRHITVEYAQSNVSNVTDDARSITFVFTRDPGQGANSNWINGAFMGAIFLYGGTLGYSPAVGYSDHVQQSFLSPNEVCVLGANGVPSVGGTTQRTVHAYPRAKMLECVTSLAASTETGHIIEIDGHEYHNCNMNDRSISVYVKGAAVGS
jgi:hypothetical protein